MARWEKVLDVVLRATSDANIEFADLCALMVGLGFQEIVNLQPKESKAKPYQVRQVRNLITRYRLGR